MYNAQYTVYMYIADYTLYTYIYNNDIQFINESCHIIY